MDRKSFLIIIICFVLLFLSNRIINKLYPPIPIPVSTNQVAVVTNAAGQVQTNAENSPSSPALPQLPAGAGRGVRFAVNTAIPEQTLSISNENARYTFTSRGGGLKLVELLKYPQTVHAIRTKRTETNDVATLNSMAVPPVLALVGDEALQGDGIYQLSPIPGGVRAEKTLSNGLSAEKDFVLGTNYVISATVHLKNTSSQPLTVPGQDWVAGSSTPMSALDSPIYQAVKWFDGDQANAIGTSYFSTNTTTLFVFPRTVQTQFVTGRSNIIWVSMQNQFFAMAAMPETNTPAAFLSVRMLGLPRPSEEEIRANSRTVREPQALEATLAYPARNLAPGQTLDLKFSLYAGPKEYRTLAQLSDRFRNHIDYIMGFEKWFGSLGSWFGPISKGLLVWMDWMHSSLKFSFGFIIVLITVILKLVFWPLTRASTRSMKRMQELQPQMKEIQQKYKDDPAKMQQKTWEFYKKNKVNPLGGCLPMLLQIPVFFGFFGMLRSAIELRGAPFLWIGDLSQPDTIFYLPFINFPVNPMPLIMAAAQFWQASLTPLSPGMDPAQQKMMRFMPLLMVVFLYNYQSGLALYWATSTLLTVLQTKVTKTITPPAATAVVQKPAVPAPRKK